MDSRALLRYPFALFATQVAALSELLRLAERQGLDPARALQLLAPLPVSAPAALGVAGLMLTEDHAPRFPVSLVAKDLRYAEQAGAGQVVGQVRARFEQAEAAGLGEQNLSAVHAV